MEGCSLIVFKSFCVVFGGLGGVTKSQVLGGGWLRGFCVHA
jgi:hypothetical protein